jgi:hypothetical protein
MENKMDEQAFLRQRAYREYVDCAHTIEINVRLIKRYQGKPGYAQDTFDQRWVDVYLNENDEKIAKRKALMAEYNFTDADEDTYNRNLIGL